MHQNPALKVLKRHAKPPIPMFFLYFAQKYASQNFTIPIKLGRRFVPNGALGGRFEHVKRAN